MGKETAKAECILQNDKEASRYYIKSGLASVTGYCLRREKVQHNKGIDHVDDYYRQSDKSRACQQFHATEFVAQVIAYQHYYENKDNGDKNADGLF
jgi:hypothetical protein